MISFFEVSEEYQNKMNIFETVIETSGFNFY